MGPEQSQRPELPREIVLEIYRATGCCGDTPEEAQRQPCACVAASIVDQIEDWVEELIRNLARTPNR